MYPQNGAEGFTLHKTQVGNYQCPKETFIPKVVTLCLVTILIFQCLLAHHYIVAREACCGRTRVLTGFRKRGLRIRSGAKWQYIARLC